jgi:hypothetical protein
VASAPVVQLFMEYTVKGARGKVYHLTHIMTNTLHNYPVMLHLRRFVTQGSCEAHLSFGKKDVTKTPQVKHHRMVVKRICHFVVK